MSRLLLEVLLEKGTCGGRGRCTKPPSVCTDPRRETTALEKGVTSREDLEPSYVTGGSKGCVRVWCYCSAGRREGGAREGEDSLLLHNWKQ